MKNKNKALIQILKEHEEIIKSKPGFPNIGKRNDSLSFSDGVIDIEKAWYYYDTELYNMESPKCKIIKLGSGNPYNYKPFPYAVKNLKKKLKSSKLYMYPPAAGNEESRTNISNYLISIGFNQKINFNNVIITNSTTDAFYLILNSICRPHDVVIMTSPCYGLFAFMPERMGIDVKFIELKKDDNYYINPVCLKNLIDNINKDLFNKYSKKEYIPCVKAFLNINPHNPLGYVLSDENIDILNGVGSVCKDTGVFIIDDLVYRDIGYNRKKLAKPIGTIDEYFNNTISMFGLSKSYGMAGVRAGFVVANEMIIRLLRNNIFYTRDSSSEIQSYLLEGAYNNSFVRNVYYKKYFNALISKYIFNMYLTIAMFDGIERVNNLKYRKLVKLYILLKLKNKCYLEGINGVNVIIIPKSGFFVLLDFTKLKKIGMIKNERHLLKILYQNCGIKFLIGQSISWPNKNDVVVRLTYSFDKRYL